jgi:hypothetical protein
MRKIVSLIVILLLISLTAAVVAFAQEDDSAVVTNVETDPDAPGAEAIIIIDPSADPEDREQPVGVEEPATAEESMHVQWNADANGTIDFPGGQQIIIGMERDLANLSPGYVSQIRLDDLGDGTTSDTEITIISGCIVIEVSSDDTNGFVVNFLNEGETAVEIQPPPEPAEPPPTVMEVLVCVTADGGAYVERISGDGVIQISSDGDTIVSNVVDNATIGPDGSVELTPSGVGAASG